MPEISKLVVVLPCHSLEDFPTHETGDSANSLLASWTALWHPSLIATTKALPIWVSQDYVTEQMEGALIIAPLSCEANLPDEITEAVEQNQAVLIGGAKSRSEILNNPAVASLIKPIDEATEDLGNDFFALSYAYLQVQLMTRQLRYSTTLSQNDFEDRVVKAANAYAADEDEEKLFECLGACFDMLLEERNNYYPTEANLLNLVLVQKNAARLTDQLMHKHAFNLLLSGDRLAELESQRKSDLDLLRQKYNSNQVDIALSSQHELPVQLVSIESLTNQIEQALVTTRKCLQLDEASEQPATFGSYRFGLSPQLPNILDQFGHRLAMHVAFSGGKLPVPSSPLINWQGNDGTNIAGLAVTPIDATAPEGFLKLATTIGEMLDSYHHADLLFVHWPGRYTTWFRDLIRIEKYGSLFGRFKTFRQYSETVYDSGFSDTYAAEDYSFPYLAEAYRSQEEKPISRWVEYWQLNYRIRSLQKLLSICSIAFPNSSFNSQRLHDRLVEIQGLLDHQAASQQADHSDLEEQITRLVEHDLNAEELLCTDTSKPLSGKVLVNPNEDPQSVFADESAGQPATFRCQPFALTSKLENSIGENAPSLATQEDENGTPVLRNEFFEVHVDATTGGILRVGRYTNKRNLFSQQLAVRASKRWKEHGFWRHSSQYTRMVASEIELRSDKTSLQHAAAVTSRGVLETTADSENRSATTLAEFEQTVSLKRGDRKIYFDVVLRPATPVSGEPWRNYIASRIAWADEDAEIYRSENEVPDRLFQEKFAAPSYVEIRSSNAKITMLPCGLPFHRRSERRMLDTLLVVEREPQSHFQFAIAIDSASSMADAAICRSPLYAFDVNDLKGMVDGWIFHLNCRNVMVTSLRPVFDAGKVTGAVFRLLETEDRSGELRISTPFTLKRAKRCKFSGEPAYELPTDGDVAIYNFLESQYFQIELGW